MESSFLPSALLSGYGHKFHDISISGNSRVHMGDATTYSFQADSEWDTKLQERTFFMIPKLHVSKYIKRDGLMTKIHDSFHNIDEDANHPTIVVLLGMGGQGKTQLALEYCRVSKRAKAKGTYKAIFWIDASSSTTAGRDFEAIASNLAQPGYPFENFEAKLEFVKQALESRNSPWLVVFDNYDRPEKFGDISNYLPSGEYGAILITSRHGDSKRLGNSIEVGHMTPSESLKLLYSHLDNDHLEDESQHGLTIVKKLGYLPLAIDQAGAYISSQLVPLKNFCVEYERRKKIILSSTPEYWEYRKKSEDDTECNISVFTTWEMSYNQISQDPSRKEWIGCLLTICSFMDASVTGVKEDIFEHSILNIWEYQDWMKPLTSQGIWDHDAYKDVMVKLRTLSLIRAWDMDSHGNLRIFLHPLVMEWLQLRMANDDRRASASEAVNILMEYIIWTKDETQVPWEAKKDLLSHLHICRSATRDILTIPNHTDEDDPHWYWEYYFASFYQDMDHYSEAETLYRCSMAKMNEKFGSESKQVLMLTESLASTVLAMGNLKEGKALLLSVIEGVAKIFGKDHSYILFPKRLLARLYITEGLNAEAEFEYHSILECWERTVDIEDTEIEKSTALIASVYYELGSLCRSQSRFSEGENLLLQAKSRLRTVERPWLARQVQKELAFLYFEDEEYRKAEKLWEELVADNRMALDHAYSTISKSIHNLGILYQIQGKYVQEEELMIKALKRQKEILGVSHLEIPDPSLRFKTLHLDYAKLDDALALCQMTTVACEGVREIYRKSHWAFIILLGSSYIGQKRFSEAEELLKEAISELDDLKGQDQKDALCTMSKLGYLFLVTERFAQSEEFYRKAFEGLKATTGLRNIETLTTMKGLAEVYKKIGKRAEAENLYLRALSEIELSIPEAREQVYLIMYQLGFLYCEENRFEEGEPLLVKALSGLEGMHCREHKEVMSVMVVLGITYTALGKISEAKELYVGVVSRIGDFKGESKKTAYRMMELLGQLYYHEGRFEEAESLLQRALTGFENLDGIDAKDDIIRAKMALDRVQRQIEEMRHKIDTEGLVVVIFPISDT